MTTTTRIQHPPAGAGGGGEITQFVLAVDKTCPGHQAGVLLASGQTFVAPASGKLLVSVDWAATVLGGSKCALTFHAGKVTPAGSRVSNDSVDRTGPTVIQGALPGVTDYREYLFPAAIDPESVPGSAVAHLLLTGLDPGATYTWEMKWGFVSGAMTRGGLGANPLRIAIDDLSMHAIVTAASGAGPTVLTVGKWQWWQAAPGLYEYSGAFPSGYEPSGLRSGWLAPLATPAIASTYGAAFAFQSAGRRFLVGSLGDNKLHLINPQTGALIVSQAVAFAADPYDLQFYPGALPSQAIVATDDSNLRIMNVSDAGIAQASAIAVGATGRRAAANLYSGANVGLWHGTRGLNPCRLRLYNTAGVIQNGANGIVLENALVEVMRILRIPTGPNAETMLVATSSGKVHHVSKDGLTVLGTWTMPTAPVSIGDIGVGPNGVLCYVIDTTAGAGRLHYFWLPNTVGGPAYQHFDTSGIGAITGFAVAVDANENVLYAGSNNQLVDLPGGAAFCRPTNPISGEHLRVTLTEAT